MRALFAKSQFVEIHRLAAFSPRSFNERLKFRARTLVVDNFFPTLVALGKLAQLVIHGAAFGLRKLWQFLDNFGCAHEETIC
jgi:hypothetical protein